MVLWLGWLVDTSGGEDVDFGVDGRFEGSLSEQVAVSRFEIECEV